ncbi:MAG: histidine kinase [Pseudomonadota bacterium]|nr:histidine kinase [Pseudomonadota bacterium]
MGILKTEGGAWHRAIIPTLQRWRRSMFWAMVPAMFLVSVLATLVLSCFFTFREDGRLRSELNPVQLQALFDRAVAVSPPVFLTQAMTKDMAPGWCVDALHVFAERMLNDMMRDDAGNDNLNSFYQAGRLGRLAIRLHMPDGRACEWGGSITPVAPALRRQMVQSRQSGASTNRVVEQADGWISAATFAPVGGDARQVTVGLYMLSPSTKIQHSTNNFVGIGILLLSVNSMAALFLVSILTRRIKRAGRAATAWTHGSLAARIDDAGMDEFSRLTRQFDLMADAMGNVIEVKKALAAADERNQLARDLHDSAKQRAFALNLQLSAAQQMIGAHEDGARLVATALSLTNHLQQDLSNVIRRLASPTIAEAGFRQVLVDAVEVMLAGSGIGWSLSLSEPAETALAGKPEISHELFLISMEAVANSLKHARCTTCAISGEQRGSTFYWRIVDNGSGGDLSPERSNGMGLASMRQRAERLPDGAFHIAPATGGGVAVTVTFTSTI